MAHASHGPAAAAAAAVAVGVSREVRAHGTGLPEWNNIASPDGVGNGCCRVNGAAPTPFAVITAASKAKCKRACDVDNCKTCFAVETRSAGRFFLMHMFCRLFV